MVGRDAIPYANLITAAAKLYGTTAIVSNGPCPNAFAGWPGTPNDSLGYTDKEYVMYWHNHQEWFKNCMVMCDAVFPLLYSSEASDYLGYYTAEADAFNAATGLNYTVAQCHQAAERIFNLMRSVHIRQGRTRAHDESVIPYFTDIASGASAYEQRNLNKTEFQALLTRYYALRGWDPTTGIPTRTKLTALGLSDVADGLAKVVTVPP
jgi:aldehyde:ferredoxin oxidoreductase